MIELIDELAFILHFGWSTRLLFKPFLSWNRYDCFIASLLPYHIIIFILCRFIF